MDQSKEYVQMCRAAKEIQDLWEAQVGDFGEMAGAVFNVRQVESSSIRPLAVYRIHDGNNMAWYTCDDLIWLPRQDQLQNMCTDLNQFKPIYSFAYVTMWAEAPGIDCGASDYAESLDSLEQVWLAYVMDENYHKKWNGEEWL